MGETGRTERGVGQRARWDGRPAACQDKTALILAGPTASGKSALAMAFAARFGGTIINADAMQCYRELRIITARPTPEDESLCPHRLYGARAAEQPANAAWWREAALSEMGSATLPILCGGTGMYFSSLVHGIADIPAPGEAARAEARAVLADIGPAALHAKLDPQTAAKLQPRDSQRIARAYEVQLATGRGLAWWQAQPAKPLAGWTLRMILLDPPRDILREAIAARFTAMLLGGALAEVQEFLALGLDPALPLMRAHGVPELAAHLRGELSLADAAARAILVTHQYTKRQATWFRHQKLVDSPAMRVIQSRITSPAQFSEREMADLSNFVNQDG